MDRRTTLFFVLVLTACGSTKNSATCPLGTKQVNNVCRRACTRDDQCLAVESCDTSVGVCLKPHASDAGGFDAISEDATNLDAETSPDVTAMDASVSDGGHKDAGFKDAQPLDTGPGDTGVAPLFLRTVTLDNSANPAALVDYPVLVVVDTKTPIRDGKMRADCADIRFTNAKGTALSYWIDGPIETTTTAIWVKVDEIPASAVKSIDLSYGDPTASPASDGKATFLYYADFDTSTIGNDGSQERLVPKAGVWSVVAGGYRGLGYEEAGTAGRQSVFGPGGWSDVAMTVRVRLPSNVTLPGGVNGLYLRATDVLNNYFFGPYDITKVTIGSYSAGAFKAIAEMPKTISTLVWHEVTLAAFGSTFRAYFDGELVLTGTDMTFSTGMIGLRTWQTAARFDELRVRPYSPPEPLVSIGPEH